MTSTTMTLTAALKKEFMPNSPAVEVMREVKALTPEDRAWYQRELENAGYIISPLATEAASTPITLQ